MPKMVPAFSAAMLAPAFAFWMRNMHQRYTGPTANLRYGNEIAQRCVDYIRSHCAPEHHARLFLSESRRLSETHWRVATSTRNSPLGNFKDKDYAEQLKQAAFAMFLVFQMERAGTADAERGVS